MRLAEIKVKLNNEEIEFVYWPPDKIKVEKFLDDTIGVFLIGSEHKDTYEPDMYLEDLIQEINDALNWPNDPYGFDVPKEG